MGTEIDVFREEDLILNHMDQVGRLDKERELDRLLNVLNDILLEYSTFSSNEIEPIYGELKRELEREYLKTKVIDVDSTEMKVWHLSMFSSIEFLQKLLVNRRYDEPKEIVFEFNKILEQHFEEQMEIFSEKHDIDDLNDRLPEPEVFKENELEVLYWQNISQEKQEFTNLSRDPIWRSEPMTGDQEIEVPL